MAESTVAYPDWYLRRWHFLPEGYLSRRSVRLYPLYIPRLYNQLRERQLTSLVARTVANGAPKRVLELGCGPGKTLAAVAGRLRDSHVTGLDLSPFFLEMARDNPALTALGATLVHGDAGCLGFDDGTFDAAYAVHLFGHMPAQAARNALQEAVRVLAPGGRLLIVDHSWHPWELPSLTRELHARSFNAGLIQLRLLERE